MKRFFLMAVLMTASCSFNHPVPGSWKLPPLAEGEKCPDISGQYMSKTEAAGKSSPPNLFDELNGGWVRSKGFVITQPLVDPTWKGEHEVSIQMVNGIYVTLVAPDPAWKAEHRVLIQKGNEDQLNILYMTTDGVILKKSVLKKEKGDFSCKNGWILTKVKIYNAPLPTTIIRSFAKAEGYLVEKVESRTFSILGFPGYAEGTNWLRYSHIESKVD